MSESYPKKKVKKRAGKVIHGMVSKHAAEKAKQIRTQYGPNIDYSTLLSILDDRKSVRYPVEIVFTMEGVEQGMFGRADPVSGEEPCKGYRIFLHERLQGSEELLPALVLYQVVSANYGDLATAIDAEIFGAGVLGMERDEYYELICETVDLLWGGQ